MQVDLGHQRADEVELGVVLPADESVDLVALLEQGSGEIEAVLARDPGDECGGYARDCAIRRERRAGRAATTRTDTLTA
ncbi:MAG: hypothetical protein WAV00_14600 [Nocardioides sp.]